ncbi:hypothetical protein VKT23_015343 [Stygiomarasmius scandens]|uniref:Uncharacterized protein n=1 Tax=Marasmiellus scandens TaxID=2682957 RepID=A0ABR1IZH2_9AGAR
MSNAKAMDMRLKAQKSQDQQIQDQNAKLQKAKEDWDKSIRQLSSQLAPSPAMLSAYQNLEVKQQNKYDSAVQRSLELKQNSIGTGQIPVQTLPSSAEIAQTATPHNQSSNDNGHSPLTLSSQSHPPTAQHEQHANISTPSHSILNTQRTTATINNKGAASTPSKRPSTKKAKWNKSTIAWAFAKREWICANPDGSEEAFWSFWMSLDEQGRQPYQLMSEQTSATSVAMEDPRKVAQ